MGQQEHLHDLAAPFALGALDAPERSEFERHLLLCERCREEVAVFEETAAALAYAVDAPRPPAELRERLLSRAREERAVVVPFRRRAALPAVAAFAAVAAGVAVGLGIWAGSLSSRLDSERDARRSETRALAVLAAAGARLVPLQGVSGTLIVASTGDAALTFADLRRAPGGKTYEAWVIGPGGPVPAGLFDGESSAVALDRKVPPGAVVAVTVERRGGVKAPTSKPILSARV